MVYRATIQDSTGFSHYKLLFGRDMICPTDIISGFSFKNKVTICPVQYVEWIKQPFSDL